jgi:hypothetical protein
MAITGEIAQKARERIPVTFDALARDGDRYGESMIQGRIDSTKRILFGEVVDADEEATLYDPLATDYAGIKVAIALIPAGADYWASQNIQHTATNRNEQKLFLDRAEKLWHLQGELQAEAAALLPLVEDLLGPSPITGRKPGVMAVKDTDDDEPFVTTDPFAFERAFERSQLA